MLTETLSALAAAGGTTVVTAMATDGWSAVKQRVPRLFGRVDPTRVAVVDGQLDDDADTVAGAPEAEREQAQAELAPAWRRRFVRLLEEQPSAEAELREAITAIEAALPPRLQTWTQTNLTHGGSTYAVQGGTQQIHNYPPGAAKDSGQ